MRLMKSLFFLSLLSLALVGCKKKDKEESKPAGDKPAETKPAETKPAEDKPAEDKPAEPTATAGDAGAAAEPTADTAAAGDWEGYFNEFKAAAAAKDKDKLAALTLIGDDGLDQGSFDMMLDTFLSKEVLEALAKTEAKSITGKDQGEGFEVWEFSWSESTTVDGEEMGSALFFYFKKVDGSFKLFRLLAAG